jgi:thymidylate synthase (FAD)
MPQVLDTGFIELLPSLANDLDVVNAARVSFAARQDEMDSRGAGLIGFLMSKKHGSPFEHNLFRFHCRAMLAVVREWERHRIASYNEQSGRYSELSDIFFVPEYVRTQVGKPGHYTYERMSEEDSEWFRDSIDDHNKLSYAKYQTALARGVAKEQARLYLPPTLMVEFWVSMNARALMNFIRLRNEESAMYEIRQYAIEVENFFAELMPMTHEAFNKHGRVVP